MEQTRNIKICEQLEQVLDKFNIIQQNFEEFIRLDPQLFGQNGNLAESFNETDSLLTEGVQRLEKPSLSIATIGTTSSGKSTLVNSLIGHRLAPMEAGEMSSGILRFTHTDKGSRMLVEKTKNSTWECHDWKEMTEKEIYLTLAAVEERVA